MFLGDGLGREGEREKGGGGVAAWYVIPVS